MISNKLLRGLNVGVYVMYDSIFNYKLHAYENNTFHIFQYGYSNRSLYVYPKDLGYTNRWKCISSVGGINIHSDFSWRDLKFFGKDKGDKTIEELMRFKKTFKSYRINRKRHGK